MSPQRPHALVVTAPGTNRADELAAALELAGADVSLVRTSDLAIADFEAAELIAFPGGFSYGDVPRAGVAWARALALHRKSLFDAAGRGVPILGICNGFQLLIELGLLGHDAKALPSHDVRSLDQRPNHEGSASGDSNVRQASLTRNANARFECRWVKLDVASRSCVWTKELQELECPVAHAEGRFVQEGFDPSLIALRYSSESYPDNPNGSWQNVAGITSRAGNVLGLMPHPEHHVLREHYAFPGEGALALPLFEAGVDHALRVRHERTQ